MMPSNPEHEHFGPTEPIDENLRFSVMRNGRNESLSYPELFAAAHRLWLRRDYQKAAEVFKRLAGVSGRGPRASVFLAHCHAMQGDFASCSSLLSRALPRALYGEAASGLHDCFVFWKIGLFVDVRKELQSLAEALPELPAISLLIADLLKQTGAYRLSRRFFDQAIRHDRPDGGIALAAQAAIRNMDRN